MKWTKAAVARLLPNAVQFGIEDWQAPLAYSNTWRQSTASPGELVGFYKDPFGVVHFRGRLERATPVGALVAETIFTLPTGYRPEQDSRFEVIDAGTGASVAGGVRVVASTGAVNAMARAGTSDQSLQLDGISFRCPVDG